MKTTLLLKKGTLVLFLSFFTLSGYSQNSPLDRGDSSSCQQTPCAPPSGASVKGSWDTFTTFRFIYWSPYQENMELGIVSNTANPNVATLDGNFINLDPGYKPGFVVGLGVNLDHDHWDLYSEYSWIRGSFATSVSLSSTGNEVLFPKWERPDISGPNYFAGNETWTLHMDLLDFQLGKEFCVGKALSLRSHFGLRAAWIRQSIEVQYLNETTGLLLNRNVFVTQRFHSWGLGPQVGLQMNWALGQGIRMYGNSSFDLLFTQYRKIGIDQQATTATNAFATSSLYDTKQTNINAVRGHLELALGFGWGTYFQNNKSHIDLSASYGFQLFFDQNMFRLFLDDQYLAASLTPNGNLFLHGLTTTIRLDF